MNDSKRILIVDDEIKIVDVIKSYLQKSGYETFEAFNGSDAVTAFEKVNPELIILDLMMPGLSGEEVCKIIRKKSRIPIIMLTAKVEEEEIISGLNIGADDYVTKPFSPRQLVARVDAVLRRCENTNKPLSNIISYNNDDLVIDDSKHEVRKKGLNAGLTPTEYKILLNMIRYPQKAFTREELLLAALGDDYNGFDRVIDTHIKNLRQKIEDNAKEPKYILTVHGIGYKFGGD